MRKNGHNFFTKEVNLFQLESVVFIQESDLSLSKYSLREIKISNTER